jgi:hypothetical protein
MRKTGFLLFGLAGAVLLSQFPEFFQQYTQRLGGRYDEVSAQVSGLEKRAAEAGKDVDGYLRGFLLNRDVDVRREGLELRSLVDRRAALGEAYQALTGSDRWWRARAFARHVDWNIATSTLTAYQPAVPVTAEAAVYAGSGFGAGALIFLLILGLWGPERRKARRREPPRIR